MKNVYTALAAAVILTASGAAQATQTFDGSQSSSFKLKGQTTHAHAYDATQGYVPLIITEGNHMTGDALTQKLDSNAIIGDDTFTSVSGHDYMIKNVSVSGQMSSGISVSLSGNTTVTTTNNTLKAADGGLVHVLTTHDGNSAMPVGSTVVTYTLEDYAA